MRRLITCLRCWKTRPLDGAYGQYKAPRLLWDALMHHRDRITAERPELAEKFKNNAQMTLADTFA